ncbi:serine/threonine-protein phosphatase 4 regulatory subunit 2-A [Clarias gariepinus]|uniref:serine/threonine-protein phosphatase 4 regulatory subunit 2-A n=1 Tax=Clarias gariepinus TaxID=13013 RepID=UPI00234D819A|nr:serine/threonine-protein phosphatase 4 regulatory subunit 2-A [Clarias gariepinus]
MELSTLLGAFRDFEKKGKKETCPILDQFLCHIAKTGETMIQWSQFKSYFLFKLEKVMDDFKASSPEQRGPANPNVEYIPFKDMKERILKIVDGYNGIPFTIQRLCELLTEPKRNYTGTEKFLRGVEKNVMVVSCVYPTSEKNGSIGVNRMNGVMFPGNASALTDRNVNGPGTPRTVNRAKLSLSSSITANGFPDSTETSEQVHEHTDRTVGDSLTSETVCSSEALTKGKHRKDEALEEDDDEDDDDDVEDRHNAKRFKMDNAEEENEASGKELSCHPPVESSTDVAESSLHVGMEMKDTSALVSEDQEPSSTQSESGDDTAGELGTLDSRGSSQSNENGCEAELSEPKAELERLDPAEMDESEENSDPVSSSSNSSSEERDCHADSESSSPGSYTEPAAEGSIIAEDTSQSSEPTQDDVEQD